MTEIQTFSSQPNPGKCFVVRVNNGESGSPHWKWHAAATQELLMKAVGDMQTLGPPIESLVFQANGNWRMKYDALEVNVIMHH